MKNSVKMLDKISKMCYTIYREKERGKKKKGYHKKVKKKFEKNSKKYLTKRVKCDIIRLEKRKERAEPIKRNQVRKNLGVYAVP